MTGNQTKTPIPKFKHKLGQYNYLSTVLKKKSHATRTAHFESCGKIESCGGKKSLF